MVGRSVIESYALVAAFGYLLGSVPFGLYAARYANERLNLPASFSSRRDVAPQDLYRRPGAGPRVAGVTFVLEVLKGFLPTLGGYLALGLPGALSGGSAVLVGHGFPAFARLRGAGSLGPLWGVLLVVYPLVVVILGMVWAAALAAWRYVSLAALVAAAVVPLALAALDAGGERYESVVVRAAVLWSLLVFWGHRDGIRRLLDGSEERIGAPGNPPGSPGGRVR